MVSECHCWVPRGHLPFCEGFVCSFALAHCCHLAEGIIFQTQCFEPLTLHPLLHKKGWFVPTMQAGWWHMAFPCGLAQRELDTQIALLCWDF